MRHAAVALAAVIGIEHDGLTKTKAFVELRAGVAPSAELATQLQDFVRGTIAKYKYPRLVEFVAELPKNDRGKVDKKALRAREPG
jgi:acyl-coenzyme A synthetase/AMP-(fatty) acid ligase